jgi:uncharacterized RDD family membrane protein YckC
MTTEPFDPTVAPIPAPPQANQWPAPMHTPPSVSGAVGIDPATSTLGRRFVAWLLDGALIMGTFGIGWFIWAFGFTFSRGQTPAKSLMGMRVANAGTGKAATWGTMFVRDVLVRMVLFAVLSTFTMGVAPLVGALMIFSVTRQTGWDRIANTIVVDDPTGSRF